MEQAIKDKIEYVVKCFTPLLTLVGIFIGVYQFNRGGAEQKAMEFKRSMYAKKLVAYESVGGAVGDLLNIYHDDQLWIEESDTLAFDSCMKNFRTLYWGVLPLVEDSAVESRMVRFKDMARYYRRQENNYIDLASEGMLLMEACKNALVEHWKREDKTEKQ